ncbi:MAG: hypothetical protein QW432_04495 [Desulfurococcaceae archaeon]
MKLSRCLDESYLDFLMHLYGLEINGLKAYDLFSAIRKEEVEIADCYKVLTRLYGLLETALGDPQLALYKLSDIASGSKLTSFLRGYGSVLLTSGDTRTYVSAALRTEFAALRAKIGEKLKFIEVLYEAILVAVLSISILSVLPLWPLPLVVGIFILQLVGLTSYITAVYVTKWMYYNTSALSAALEVFFILASNLLLVSVLYGLVVHLLVFGVLCVIVMKPVKRRVAIEGESLKILNDTYSQIMLGEPADIALLNSLKRSPLLEFRLLLHSLLSGFRAAEIIRKLKFPVLAFKVMSGLVTLMHYSPPNSTHVTSIIQFVDEVSNLRKYVEEKAKHYLLYSGIVVLLIVASYVMIARMPAVVNANARVLGVYAYVSAILTAMPACLLKDRTFIGSKLAVPATILASMTLVLLYTGIF